jgi:hypothetical protein
MGFGSDIGLERFRDHRWGWLRRSCVGWNSHAHRGADRRLRGGRSRTGREGRAENSEPSTAMRKQLLLALPLLLAACANDLTEPAQPTGPGVEAAYTQLLTLQDANGNPLPPATTWTVADGSVRAACHAYLNGAAKKQTTLSLGSIGLGAVGAGMSLVNPLAGVAASLGQTTDFPRGAHCLRVYPDDG